MNLPVFILFMATITSKNFVLADPKENEDCKRPTIENESMRINLAFQEAGIVPDLLPISPRSKFGIVFDSIEADFGNYLSPIRTQEAPLFELEDADPAVLYTFIVLDADYPSRTSSLLRFEIISLCVNVAAASTGDVQNYFIVAPWIPPGPSVGSGQHRLIALAYAQNGVIRTNDRALIDLGTTRIRFDLEAFVRNYTLGDLVAGNFWMTSIDECSTLHHHQRCHIESKWH